jgi:hypothetical protein
VTIQQQTRHTKDKKAKEDVDNLMERLLRDAKERAEKESGES